MFVKFWLHVSPEEQLGAFEARQGSAARRWKLTDEDWRNRKKRKRYEEAVEEMFERTTHPRRRGRR